MTCHPNQLGSSGGQQGLCAALHTPCGSSPCPLPVSRRVVVPSLSGILTEPAHNATPTFPASLPMHSPSPTSSLTCQSRYPPTHTFPYSLHNPPILTFLIHLLIQLHNLSLKHLQDTQGEELCLPRPSCLINNPMPCIHPAFPEFE